MALLGSGPRWRRNYPSLNEHVKLVQTQFEDEAEEGLMVETIVGGALKTYGDRLEIASTAAIEKKGRTDEVRVLYDGSNGLDLNPGIRRSSIRPLRMPRV